MVVYCKKGSDAGKTLVKGVAIPFIICGSELLNGPGEFLHEKIVVGPKTFDHVAETRIAVLDDRGKQMEMLGTNMHCEPGPKEIERPVRFVTVRTIKALEAERLIEASGFVKTLYQR